MGFGWTCTKYRQHLSTSTVPFRNYRKISRQNKRRDWSKVTNDEEAISLVSFVSRDEWQPQRLAGPCIT